MFFYYALIGVNSPRTYIRVYSLSIVNTIAQFNTEGVLEITDKVLKMSLDPHWEVKTQSLYFAVNVLKFLAEYQSKM